MADWKKAGTIDDFDEGLFGVRIDDTFIAVYQLEDGIYATDDKCTHGKARLSRGFLDGEEIECPVHQGLFCVKTGAATGAPCVEPIKTYKTDLRGHEIFVDLDSE